MLPDLPEIALNTNRNPAPSMNINPMPELPDYGDEIKKITVVEVKDEGYDEHLPTMERSSYNEPLKEIKLSSPPTKTQSINSNINKNYIKKDNEVFVKIKKFENAMSSFDDINEKIREMQEDIEKSKRLIKEETKELEEWEKELTQMKKSLDTIDKNLFSEIEN